MGTRLTAVADALGHRFNDPNLLLQACTHASHCGAHASDADRRRDANERLEYLGDALLGAAMGLLLYHRHEQVDEGELSRLKSHLVSRAVLARAMDRIGLLDHCRVGPQLDEPWPASVKANLAESLLAAVYLDGGWEALNIAVERLLGSYVDEQPPAPAADVKNRLQSWALEHHKQLPEYDTVRDGGSDHAPRFLATVRVGERSAQGAGGSRRKAESAAAARFLAQEVEGQ